MDIKETAIANSSLPSTTGTTTSPARPLPDGSLAHIVSNQVPVFGHLSSVLRHLSISFDSVR